MLTWILISVAIVAVIWLLRRVLLRKWVLIPLIALVVLTPIVVVTSLLYSETGLRLAQGQLTRLERFGIRIEGVSGTLAGPLYVRRFELVNPNVHIVSHDLVIQPRIRQLFIQTIGVSSLTARDTVVEILHAPPTPPPTKPLRFLPSFMRIDVDNGHFTTLRYVNIDGTAIDARQLTGAVTLTPRRIRVREFSTQGDWFEISGSAVLQAQRPLGLELETHGILKQGDVEYALDGGLDGTIDRLGMKAQLKQPTLASVDAVLTRPNDSWRIAGKVTSPEFSLRPWVEKPPFSMRDVALDVTFDPQGIHAQGELIVPEVDAQPLRIDAKGRYGQRVITIEQAALALAQSPTRIRASGTVAIDGANSVIDAQAQWSSLQWPLRGTAIVSSETGSGTLQGSLPYRFSVDTQIAGPNIPTANGTASGTIAKDLLTLDAFDVAALNGRVSGLGSLQLSQPRAWQMNVQAADIDTGLVDARFPGRLDIKTAGSGSGLDKKARFNVTVSELRGHLREQAIRGHGSVERDARGWRARRVRMDYGSAKLALDGELRDTIRATWSITAPALEQLLPDAHGSLISSGDATGPLKQPHVVGTLSGERIGYQGWRAQRLRIDADVDLAGTTQSRLDIEADAIGSASKLIETLRINGSGSAASHVVAIAVVGTPTNPQQPGATADVRIEGQYTNATWTGTVKSTEIKAGSNERLALVEPGRLILNSERALLDPLCFALGNGRFCAEGKWQSDGPWDATVSGYELPLAAFLPPSGAEATYSGKIEGRVRVFGQPGTLWQGEAGMRIVDAAIVYRPQGAEPETLNLGTGGIAATATPDKLNFSFGVQAFTDTFLFANATIDRQLGVALTSSALKGDFRARAADANILPIVFPDIDNAAGLFTANGQVSGTLAAPQIDGRIELQNGEFDSYRVNLALRNLNLVANLAGNAINFHGSGKAGDGQLDVDGRFEWYDGASRGRFGLRGQDLLVADLPEYRVVASPDLKFEIDGRTLNATGTVKIPSARVQPADLRGAVQRSEDARYVGESPAEREGRMIVNSDIRIEMGDDVRIETFGLQGRILGGVATVIHTGQTPIGRGELSVEQGRYEAYGQKLAISRGKLLFEASPLADPGLDIEAQRKVESITVGLNVRGTLQQPRLSFFSEPSMPQTQIVSYLLVGKPIENMQSGDAATVNSAQDALTVQGGGLLASQIGRRIGLEEVGVESSTDSQGTTNQQLVLGKFLSPRLFISYGISLTESVNTLKLRYTISDRWVLKTESGENQSADVEFTVER